MGGGGGVRWGACAAWWMNGRCCLPCVLLNNLPLPGLPQPPRLPMCSNGQLNAFAALEQLLAGRPGRPPSPPPSPPAPPPPPPRPPPPPGTIAALSCYRCCCWCVFLACSRCPSHQIPPPESHLHPTPPPQTTLTATPACFGCLMWWTQQASQCGPSSSTMRG